MGYVDGSIYWYAPNKVAPIIFAVLFAISGVVHFIQTWHYGSWRTTGLLPWASIVLTVGYAFRAYGAFHYTDVDVYIVSTVLIFSGPPVLAFIQYMVLSRILYYVPYLSPMHPGRVLTTFLGADVICEVLIVVGAQRVVNANLDHGSQEIGQTIIKVALIMQALLFVSFLLVAGNFHRKAQKARVLKRNLKFVLTVMYISSLIILARCIYRIVEYFQGSGGSINHHEAYFYVFEASFIFIDMLMLNIFHPGKRLPRSNKLFLSKDGTTELRGPGWSSGRPLWAKFLDPFDFWGLIIGRDKKTRFWELSSEQLAALVEQKRIERAQRSVQPRHIISWFLDPLHLFGHNGMFTRMFDWMDGEEPVDTSILDRHSDKDLATYTYSHTSKHAEMA